jgi:FtsZ-binding cell division protein ZapB
MSNNVHEILAAINDAAVAYDRVPQLEAVIADQNDTITLLRMELDELKAADFSKQVRIDEQNAYLLKLEHELAIEHQRNGSLECRVYDLTDAHNKAQAKITDQASSLQANEIMLKLLEADKASLTARLADYDNIGDKLKLALTKAAPAAVEVAATTFPQPVVSGEGNVSVEPVQSEPLVETVRVDAEPMMDEPKIDGDRLDWLKGPSQVEPETVAVHDYNPFNRF